MDKEIPITERYPEKSRLEIGNTDYLLARIDETLQQHLSLVYEDVCRELCLDLLKQGIMNFSAIGRWWAKNKEIDLVALDDETRTIWFGECKWSAKPVGEDVYRDLRRKAELVEWGGRERHVRSILFSGRGFTAGMRQEAKQDGVVLVSGEQLVG